MVVVLSYILLRILQNLKKKKLACILECHILLLELLAF